LQDNQGQGSYESWFHSNSVSGQANPVSTFNIGQTAESSTAVFVDGKIDTAVMTATAHARYDLNVNSFGWVTSGAGTCDLTADSTVNSGDDVGIQFGIDADVSATQSLAMNAGFGGSSVNLLTKIHYSEAGILPSPHSDTNATTVMTGLVYIDNNDQGTAVTSPHITSQTSTDLGADLNWDFTAGNNNTHESYRSHILDSSGNQIELRNDFANTSALPAAAGVPAQKHIDPQTGWILLGDHFDEPQAGDHWIELSDSYAWHGRPIDGDWAGATAE
jgi:hypothetical protein